MSNDWKSYEKQPDDGLYGNIMRRLKVRRAFRLGGMAAGALIFAGAAALLVPRQQQQDSVDVKPVEAAPVEQTVALQQHSAMTSPATTTQTSHSEVGKTEPVETVEPALPIPQEVEEAQPQVLAQEPQEPATTRVATTVQPQEPQVEHQAQTSMEPVISLEDEEYAEETDIEEEPEPKSGIVESSPVHISNLIWAPNIICPNGEVEKNRTFSVVINNSVSEFKLYIYNRRGQRLYTTTDQHFAWDATAFGSAVPQGAYVWIATFRDSEGNQRSENGTVTVVR